MLNSENIQASYEKQTVWTIRATGYKGRDETSTTWTTSAMAAEREAKTMRDLGWRQVEIVPPAAPKPSSVQRFRALTFAFLDEFSTDELADLHKALDEFIKEAKGILDYDEAYEMFFRGLPGFDSFAAEYAARRFSRYAALSNCGPAETLYGYELVAAKCHGRAGAK